MSDTLNAKQRRFVEEYLIDLNATRAAIRAGYSPKTAHSQGPRLLEHVGIQAAIRKAQKLRSSRTGISQDWVIGQLREVADRCMQAVPVLDRSGNPIMVETSNGEMAPAYTFQAMGATRALDLLGKHLGMYQGRALSIELPKLESSEDAVLAIETLLLASSEGRITIAEAQQVSAIIETYRRTVETEQLERRLSEAEDALRERDAR